MSRDGWCVGCGGRGPVPASTLVEVKPEHVSRRTETLRLATAGKLGALRWSVLQRSDNGIANHILIMMACAANTSWECFMALPTIAEHVQRSVKIVERKISYLLLRGYLEDVSAQYPERRTELIVFFQTADTLWIIEPRRDRLSDGSASACPGFMDRESDESRENFFTPESVPRLLVKGNSATSSARG